MDNTSNSNEMNKKALAKVEALIFEAPISKGTGEQGTAKSEQLPNDPFSGLSKNGKIVDPPFDMLTLSMLGEHSAELPQCIRALVVNIDMTGHRFVSRLRMDDVTETTPTSESTGKTPSDVKPEQTSPEAVDPERVRLLDAAHAEKVVLTNWFEHATDESFVEFRSRLRTDLEYTGNAYFEVLRDVKGRIVGLCHIPSYQMRLGKLDEDASFVDKNVLELQVDGSVKVVKRKVYKRFRRFAQSRVMNTTRVVSSLDGHKVRWFKEFGDPRQLHKDTGDFEEGIPESDRANEVVHLKIYSPRSPYGMPRFIGQLLTIFGDRAAEEINFTTFMNNNIPSMMIMVSNGQLTQGTLDRIQSFVESNVQTSQNRSKFLLIQAEPMDEDGEDGGNVKIEAQPLTNAQIGDAMFQQYSSNNRDSIRRVFRLPPIFVGVSKDYTRATAESSRRLADEQIFAPDRDEFDRMINRVLFPNMGIIYHRFKSNSPNTTDNTQLVRILAGAEKTGGMTPAIARAMLEDILGLDLPPFPKEFPKNVPFSLTMAEAVKNKADPAEPGQQVTALKSLQALGILGDDGEFQDVDLDDEGIEKVTKNLLALNRAAEVLWRAQGTKLEG